MLTNPAARAAPGATWPASAPTCRNGVGGDYDWIGFDPRGTGASRPRVIVRQATTSATEPAELRRRPTKTDLRAWVRRAKKYDADCGKKNGAILDHMTTTRLGARHGQHPQGPRRISKINYYGFSYGTYLGQVYATLYPSQRASRFVLDSNVDPRQVWYGANLDQDTRLPEEHDRRGSAGWPSTTASIHLGRPRRRSSSAGTRSARRWPHKADHGIGAGRVDRRLPRRRVLPASTWDDAGSAVQQLRQRARTTTAVRHAYGAVERPPDDSELRRLQRRPVHRQRLAEVVGDSGARDNKRASRRRRRS